MDTIYSIPQLARLLSCSRTHLYKLIEDGKLNPRYLGNRVYFLHEDVINAMSEKPARDSAMDLKSGV